MLALAAPGALSGPALAEDDEPSTLPYEPRLREGAAALEAGRLEDARGWFTRALDSSDRVRAAAWFDLCLTYYAMGDLGRALNSCYRSLPTWPVRSLELLARIGERMQAAGLDLSGVLLPVPSPGWYDADAQLLQDLHADAPGPDSGAVRSRPLRSQAQRLAALSDPIPAERLDAFRVAAPPLPYRVPPRAGDYADGWDVALSTGALFYARDATPLVAGLQVAKLDRDYGDDHHRYFFGGYLQALDGNGGIAMGGIGAASSEGQARLGGSAGLSIPWGKQDKIQGALFPGYTLSLDADLRVTCRLELPLGLYLEAAAAAGVNLGKLGALIVDGIGSCRECESTDHNPNWPIGHAMLTVDLGLGRRSGRPPYDHFEVFSPLGGRP